MKNETILYVARHGQTYFNRSQRVQGWSDTPLTPNGASDITALGKGLSEIPFARAYASDAGRARETASLVLAEHENQTLQLLSEPRIREWGFGSWEGLEEIQWWQTMADLAGFDSLAEFQKETFSLEQMADAICQVDTEGWAEDYQTLTKRTLAGFTEMATEVENNGGGNIFAVSHGLTIALFLFLVSPTSVIKGMDNGGISKLRFADGKFEVLSINDMTYMENGK